MIVVGTMIYLLIGALIWMALDGAGAVAGASTLGRSVTATAMMIVAWPRVVWAKVRGMLF